MATDHLGVATTPKLDLKLYLILFALIEWARMTSRLPTGLWVRIKGNSQMIPDDAWAALKDKPGCTSQSPG